MKNKKCLNLKVVFKTKALSKKKALKQSFCLHIIKNNNFLILVNVD